MQRVLLASASPRRRDLLLASGLHCVTVATQVDEQQLPAESAPIYVERIAKLKLQAALDSWNADLPAIVLAADTTVDDAGAVLGKPRDAAEARAFLERLSGRSHFVRTCFALGHGPSRSTLHVETVSTEVCFRTLSAGEMNAYIASGEPFDKAGGYGIQSGAAGFVRFVRGSYTNVVGLPVAEVLDALARYAQT
jgi:septum formation protein